MYLSKQPIFRAQASNTLNNEQTELEANIFLLQIDFFVFILDGEEANLVLRTLNYIYQYHLFFVFQFLCLIISLHISRKKVYYNPCIISIFSFISISILYYIICSLILPKFLFSLFMHLKHKSILFFCLKNNDL